MLKCTIFQMKNNSLIYSCLSLSAVCSVTQSSCIYHMYIYVIKVRIFMCYRAKAEFILTEKIIGLFQCHCFILTMYKVLEESCIKLLKYSKIKKNLLI